VDVDFVVEALEGAVRLVDFLHVTGGEPLLQWEALAQLFDKVRRLDLAVSLNTNCTLVRPFAKLLEKGLVDHLATDLKVPFHVLVGLPKTVADVLWKLYLECLTLAAKYGIKVELRIPVPANIEGYLEELDKTLNAASERLGNTEWYVIVIPLLGHPYVNPRDKTWCEKHCNPSRTVLDEVVAVVRRYTSRVYVSQLARDLLD